jgi:hypothetical protein
MNENNNTNTIFFTIEKTFNQTTFASEKYNFMVPDTEQKAGTNGKCQ